MTTIVPEGRFVTLLAMLGVRSSDAEYFVLNSKMIFEKSNPFNSSLDTWLGAFVSQHPFIVNTMHLYAMIIIVFQPTFYWHLFLWMLEPITRILSSRHMEWQHRTQL